MAHEPITIHAFIASFVAVKHEQTPYSSLFHIYVPSGELVQGQIPIGKTSTLLQLPYDLENPSNNKLDLYAMEEMFKQLQTITNGPSRPHSLKLKVFTRNFTTASIGRHIARVLNTVHIEMYRKGLSREEAIELANCDYKLPNYKNQEFIKRVVEEGIKMIENIQGSVEIRIECVKKGSKEQWVCKELQNTLMKPTWEFVNITNFRNKHIKEEIAKQKLERDNVVEFKPRVKAE